MLPVLPGRLLTFLRISGACCIPFLVFLFGMWLTWPGFPYNPSRFPINQKFVAISLNGDPLIHDRMAHLPTFEVRRSTIFWFRTSGHGGCNGFDDEITLLSGRLIVWKNVYVTAVWCSAGRTEKVYFDALFRTTRWRIEKGTLILENDTNSLRFVLAPR